MQKKIPYSDGCSCSSCEQAGSESPTESRLITEELIPFRLVPKHLPKRTRGRPVHISAIYRWATRGIRGVRLECLQLPGGRYTSPEALNRFFLRLSRQGHAAQFAPPSPRQRIESDAATLARVAQKLGLPTKREHHHEE